MLLLLPVLLPLFAAAAAYLLRSERFRPWLLPVTACAHAAGVVLLVRRGVGVEFGGWLILDDLGKLALLTISLLFFGCAWYAPAYLRFRAARSNRIFCACCLALLGAMSLVPLGHHLGLTWVAVEATTLASAPLLYFNRTPRSLEATWKYLLICSIGLALALLGSFFLAYAQLVQAQHPSLLFSELIQVGPTMSKPWLRAAFVTLLVGYGTKMGLAPMHTWKPDAYGEAPGLVGALFAGGITTCAFVCIARVAAIVNAAGEGAFAGNVLVMFGLFSMLVAAALMVGQKDYRRMLSYSSVEHMGILAIGLGVGGLGLVGALLHVLANAVTKGVLFLASGNIHRAYDSNSIDEVQGALKRVPFSGALFLCGFFAITGSPPFAPFVSILTVLRGIFAAQRYMLAAGFLLLLFAVFIAMGQSVLQLLQGEPAPATTQSRFRDRPGFIFPIIGFLIVGLVLGLHPPASLMLLLQDAAANLQPPLR